MLLRKVGGKVGKSASDPDWSGQAGRLTPVQLGP